MKERIKFIFRNYPLAIVTSNSIRGIKYECAKSKLLKKFLRKGVFQFDEGDCYRYRDIDNNILSYSKILINNYSWKLKRTNKLDRYFLVDKDDNYVLSNQNKAGKQKTKIINGQDLHQLTMPTYVRAKIITTLKEYYLKELKNYILPKDIIAPVHIKFVFYSNDNKIQSDLNNHALFYEKTFTDVIQKQIFLNKEQGKVHNEFSIINDDNIENYTSFEIHHCYLPETEKNHYLVITLFDSVNNKLLLDEINIINNLIYLIQ